MTPIDSLRQRLHPREFRIARPTSVKKLLALLDQFVVASQPKAPSAAIVPARIPSAGASAISVETGDLLKFFANLGTGMWRLRQKMVLPESNEPLPEMQRAWRHFDSLWDLVGQIGLEIQDHTGTAYHAGLSLSVVAFQPTEGITEERVLETIRPSIYFEKRLLQMGEVIVGSPVSPSGNESPSELKLKPH